MKILYFLVLLFIFILGTVYGLSIEIFEIFPYEIFKNINTYFLNNQNSNVLKTYVANFNIVSLIDINNDFELENKQNLIKQYIWKDFQNLENLFPTTFKTNINNEKFDGLKNIKNISEIQIEMDYGVSSIAYLFESNFSNKDLVIYNHGHDGNFLIGTKTIQTLIDNGYDVLAFSMPLIGENNQPIVSIKNFGEIHLNSHNKFKFLDNENFSSLKFFVEPIYASLNYLDKNYDYDKYHMIGISGGGWTSVFYSSFDNRISKTFSIAGSLPVFLRIDARDFGDYEQTDTGYLSIANYLELYMMSSFGEDRSLTLIYNLNDPCCFAGKNSLLMLEPLQNSLKNLGNGSFDILIDDTHHEHMISDYSLKKIIEKLN